VKIPRGRGENIVKAKEERGKEEVGSKKKVRKGKRGDDLHGILARQIPKKCPLSRKDGTEATAY